MSRNLLDSIEKKAETVSESQQHAHSSSSQQHNWRGGGLKGMMIGGGANWRINRFLITQSESTLSEIFYEIAVPSFYINSNRSSAKKRKDSPQYFLAKVDL